MRFKGTWLLAAVGASIACTSAFADFSRDVTIVAEYAMTDNNGNPISAAGGGTLRTSVSHTFNIDSDFVLSNVDNTGTAWYTYVGPDVRLGSHNNADHSPWVRAHGDNNEPFQIGIRQDPMVVANFNVAAGIMNTNFTITSSLVSGFGSIVNGSAIASAAISVTDSATFGDPGFVSITGLQNGSNAFSARFNNLSSPVTFTDLIQSGSASIAQGGTHAFVGNSANFPNYTFVPGAVTDIQSQFSFTLSRFDRAAGTSTFEIIPAPGSVGLLAIGGLVAARRRRTR